MHGSRRFEGDRAPRILRRLTSFYDKSILFHVMNLLSGNKESVPGRQKAFAVASWLAFVAWVVTALIALLVATLGAIGLTGWGTYRYQVDVPVPGLSLHLSFQPSWGVSQGGDVCDPVRLNGTDKQCYGIVLFQGEPRQDGDALLQGDVRPDPNAQEIEQQLSRIATASDAEWVMGE